MFITLFDTDEAFDWTPKREGTNELYDSTFHLRPVTDAAYQEIRTRHTERRWDDELRRMVDKTDESAFAVEMLDYAIVGWSGLKSATTGTDVPCTAAMKAKLPDKWKVHILRLCSAKDGEMLAQGDQEKKPFAPISSSKPTPVRTSSVA